MDKGAYFYKCDFQVHTPRDINWYGDDAVTNEERTAYSESLVHACRLKGVRAIAVTDHHDFAFFPYIKRAAAGELDDAGQLHTSDRATHRLSWPRINASIATMPSTTYS